MTHLERLIAIYGPISKVVKTQLRCPTLIFERGHTIIFEGELDQEETDLRDVVRRATMNATLWASLPPPDRARLTDYSSLTPDLAGFEGRRVEVIDMQGKKRRFYVGRSTGMRPIHLEIKTRRSQGGDPADKAYKAVRVIE